MPRKDGTPKTICQHYRAVQISSTFKVQYWKCVDCKHEWTEKVQS